jgi:hypothetical protein
MTEWERLQADIEDILRDVDSLSVGEIVVSIGRDYDMTLKALKALECAGRVRKVKHDDGMVSYGPPLPEEPEVEEPPVTHGPPPQPAAVFRDRRNFPYFPEDDIRDRFIG